MPCYDDRPERDCQLAVRVACEMSKKLTLWQKDELSKEAKGWIKEHEELDRNKRDICPDCGRDLDAMGEYRDYIHYRADHPVIPCIPFD